MLIRILINLQILLYDIPVCSGGVALGLLGFYDYFLVYGKFSQALNQY